MKKSFKRFFKNVVAGAMTVVASCVYLSGCGTATTQITPPTYESPSTVVSVVEDNSVGLTPGFAFPQVR